jgi:hypothetical protein
MNVKGLAGIAAMVGLGCGVGAQAAPRTQMIALINDIDSRFVCPETLPSDADRSAALTSFAKRLAASNVTYAQATHILDLMLKRHNCSATVAEPALTASAPIDPEPLPLAAPVMTVASAIPAH